MGVVLLCMLQPIGQSNDRKSSDNLCIVCRLLQRLYFLFYFMYGSTCVGALRGISGVCVNKSET